MYLNIICYGTTLAVLLIQILNKEHSHWKIKNLNNENFCLESLKYYIIIFLIALALFI